MKKTLILIDDKSKYFWPFIPFNNDFFDVDVVYEKKYRRFPLWLRRKMPGLSYYKFGKLGKWKKQINKYDRIIVFDSAYSKQIDNVILGKHFENGCFFFYWNKMHADPLFARKQVENINSKFKIYSFNRTDCLKYKIFYNSAFYYPCALKKQQKILTDVCFLGAVKKVERLKELDVICGIFERLGISSWLHVYGVSDYTPKNFVLSSERIDYREYLDIVSSCRVVLDIDVYREESCSLRAMEALFFDKKYITNNINIKKEKFYSPKNIFILGSDDLERLYSFVFDEVTSISNEIKEEYMISSWVGRFK